MFIWISINGRVTLSMKFVDTKLEILESVYTNIPALKPQFRNQSSFPGSFLHINRFTTNNQF